eukprot:CAMPEP_0172929526 /NCGR_PEP_ID=MMETSP1075-20121228/218527_1 /TAXON_ID=2916 /ORGANISM="Ceratium fusus, Strain PA161109" /LENGTH=444 /DNA_ID=CAMNT_0013790821 /DNA_START=72 /DNA_END=1406 /DNA_ORIENTATION=+
MEVAPEFNCPLCHDLFHDPVLTPCGHSFCRVCISRACGPGHNGCPLCRGGLQEFEPHTALSNIDLAAKMVAAVPQSVLAQRQSEAPYQLQLVINNLHEETASTGNKSKWSMWVALRGLFNKHTATIIERVVYELDPTCKENCVTSYPPFFSLRRHGSAPSMVRCRIHWAPMLGICPTTVDHYLTLGENDNGTLRTIDVDDDTLDTLALKVLKRVPSSIKQQQKAPMLGICPTTVDHYLTLGENDNGTLRTIDVDDDTLDTLELKVLKRVPSSIKQQTKNGPAKLPNVGPVSLNALGLELPQRKTSKQLVFWVPPQTCTTQDESLLEVAVANRHTALPWQDDVEPCHEWTMYVLLPGFQMLKSAMIKQVVYNFGQDTYTLNAPNFELTCTGFAAFKVICTIYWNPTLGLQPTTLVHELVSNEIGGANLGHDQCQSATAAVFCLTA